VRTGAAVAVLLALVVLAGGCGGGGESRRQVVGGYIDQVNLVEARLRAPARSISQASRALATKRGAPAAMAAELRTAATKIDRQRARLAAVDAPPEAGRLRALLLELAGGQASLAREVAALAAFLPAYSAASRPLDASRASLRDALARKGSVGAKADALDAYAAAIGRVLPRLRRLRPPSVAAPGLETETATLVRVRASAAALAAALRAKRAADLSRLVLRFERASLGDQSLAAQRARIAAVRAYNARVARLDTLLLRIDRERARLEKTLD